MGWGEQREGTGLAPSSGVEGKSETWKENQSKGGKGWMLGRSPSERKARWMGKGLPDKKLLQAV